MSKGDKFCKWCGAWLGNYLTGETPEGQASYYSIINRKYCPACYPYKRKQDIRSNMHYYRKRKKELDKKRDQAFIDLQAENKALKQMLMQLREEIDSLSITHDR